MLIIAHPFFLENAVSSDLALPMSQISGKFGQTAFTSLLTYVFVTKWDITESTKD